MSARMPSGALAAPYSRRMWVSTRASNADRFTGFSLQVEPFKDQTIDAQDMFSNVEDIWMRLARNPAFHCAVKANANTGVRLVMFRQVRKDVSPDTLELLGLASSHRTYAWGRAGGAGSLIADAQWCGDVLVLEFLPSRQLAKSIDGEALDWQLCSLCMRLQQCNRRGGP